MNADTFWTNPQYRVTVIDADEGDADNTGSLIIALLQKERRLKRAEGAELLTIGYAVYKVCRRLVRGSILCDPIRPNSTPQLTDPTQPNPVLVGKFGPNPTRPNTTNDGAYSLV